MAHLWKIIWSLRKLNVVVYFMLAWLKIINIWRKNLMYVYISWCWTEKLYMENHIDADMWQVQLAINVHKVNAQIV